MRPSVYAVILFSIYSFRSSFLFSTKIRFYLRARYTSHKFISRQLQSSLQKRKKNPKLTPSVPIVVLSYLTVSVFRSPSWRIIRQSYTLLGYSQFSITIARILLSFIPHLFFPLFSHFCPILRNHRNGRRNNLFYYLLSAYLFSLYLSVDSLLFFILTELKPKLELIIGDVNDLRLPVRREMVQS